MVLYAAPSDVQADPEQVEPLIRLASLMVTHETRRATYQRNPDGTPASDTIRGILKDATLAQVGYWLANNMDPENVTTTTRVVASKSIDGAAIAYGDTQALSEEQRTARTTLCHAARLILSTTGLTGGHPAVRG